MRPSTWRGLLAVLSALVLLAAACGDDADDAATVGEEQPADDGDDATDGDGGGDGAAPGSFCAQIETADAAFDTLDESMVGLDSEAFSAALRMLARIEPPGAIRDDWDQVIAALGEVVVFFEEFALDDPEFFAQLEDDPELAAEFERRSDEMSDRFEGVDESGNRVTAYVLDECGIDLNR